MRPLAAVAALLLAAVLPTGCGGDQDPASAVPERASVTSEYLPGREADVYLPDVGTLAQAPIAVLVPGGAWQTADRSGLGRLAAALAEDGMVVVNATHDAVDDGATYPGPVRDVVCSVAFAAEQARAAGYQGGPLVLVGHSSGGHLAVLAALATQEYRADCPHAPVSVDGVVGLAGLYDVDKFPDIAEDFFAASREEEPVRWSEGNPIERVRHGRVDPDVPVLLIHGTDDDLVSPLVTYSFAAALRRAGHEVSTKIMNGVDHADVVRADVVEPLLASWIGVLAPAASPTP